MAHHPDPMPAFTVTLLAEKHFIVTYFKIGSIRINLKICFVFREDTEGHIAQVYFVRLTSLLFLQKTSQILDIHPVKYEIHTTFHQATSHISETQHFVRALWMKSCPTERKGSAPINTSQVRI